MTTAGKGRLLHLDGSCNESGEQAFVSEILRRKLRQTGTVSRKDSASQRRSVITLPTGVRRVHHQRRPLLRSHIHRQLGRFQPSYSWYQTETFQKLQSWPPVQQIRTFRLQWRSGLSQDVIRFFRKAPARSSGNVEFRVDVGIPKHFQETGSVDVPILERSSDTVVKE